MCLPRRKVRASPRNFHRVLDVTCCPWCCMGRRARPWGRAGRVANADGCCFCRTADTPARSNRVSRFAGWVLELQNQYPVTCLCFCFVLRLACCQCRLVTWSWWRRVGVMHLVRFVRIESQGLAKPCSTDLFVPLRPRRSPWCISRWTQKWVLLVAFREEMRYQVVSSYAEHPVFTSLGGIKQPCTRLVSDRDLVRRFF